MRHHSDFNNGLVVQQMLVHYSLLEPEWRCICFLNLYCLIIVNNHIYIWKEFMNTLDWMLNRLVVQQMLAHYSLLEPEWCRLFSKCANQFLRWRHHLGNAGWRHNEIRHHENEMNLMCWSGREGTRFVHCSYLKEKLYKMYNKAPSIFFLDTVKLLMSFLCSNRRRFHSLTGKYIS